MLKALSLALATSTVAAVAPAIVTTAVAAPAAIDGPAKRIVAEFALDRRLKDRRITSSSGLAPSNYARRLLWTHNDGGDSARVFGVAPGGETRAVVRLAGSRSTDVEDVAAGPGKTLWVADIGDDKATRTTISVHRIQEPRRLVRRASVNPVSYRFRFPDGPHNAETLLVHPTTGRLFIVSKQASGAGVYAAPHVLSVDAVNTLTRIADAPARISAGSFTPDGETALLTNEDDIYSYGTFAKVDTVLAKPTMASGESLTLNRAGTRILVGTEGVNSPVYAARLSRAPIDRPTSPPPTPAPPTTATPPISTGPKARVASILGVYNGTSGERPDERTRTSFGAYPAVSNTYYQPSQSIDFAYETARIRRGTSPNLTITSKGTQHLAGIVRGDKAALAWLDRYVAGLKRLSLVDPSVPVYATVDHEFLSKVNTAAVTGPSADPTIYGKALDIFYRKVNAVAPKVVTTYWMVGYDRTFEGRVGAAFTVKPEAILFDPYAKRVTDTLATITKGDMGWIKSQPWYRGQLIGLAEFGMPVRHGDDALARFYRDLPGQLRALGIGWAVFFNRTRDNDHQITPRADGRGFPKAMAAFRGSLSRA